MCGYSRVRKMGRKYDFIISHSDNGEVAPEVTFRV